MGSQSWPCNMRTPFLILFSFLILPVIMQRQPCRSDGECGRLERSHCRGINFIFCFGRTEKISLGGKCIQRKCAGCLKNADCKGTKVCSNYSCVALNDYIDEAPI